MVYNMKRDKSQYQKHKFMGRSMKVEVFLNFSITVDIPYYVYQFHVENIVIRHLYNLRSDQPSKSNTPLTPHTVSETVESWDAKLICCQLKRDYYICKIFQVSLMKTTQQTLIVETQNIKRKEPRYITILKNHQFTRKDKIEEGRSQRTMRQTENKKTIRWHQ